MTESELAHTVSQLEVHVLESFALKGVEGILIESNYKRLSISPRQAATIFQAIKGIYKYLHEADGDSSAFSLSDSFCDYLKEYHRKNKYTLHNVAIAT
jgi:hypothetical protein